MPKPVIFISHISEEKTLAIELKRLIENSFLGMMDVFVSSDENSVSSGQRWLDDITDALANCSVEIILCSPVSVKRPWINFEAGAGWIRKIPVIPLCHSGMDVSKLPIPLNLLQAVRISEIPSLKLIFPVLAEAIGAQIPDVDFTEFVRKVHDFEDDYTYWNLCKIETTKLRTINSDIYNALKSGNINIKAGLSEIDIHSFEQLYQGFLGQKGLFISIQHTQQMSLSTNGAFYGVMLSFSPQIVEVLNSPKLL